MPPRRQADRRTRTGPDRPGWAEPGQLTKVAGEEKWGRVAYLMRCCGERIVEFAPQEDGQDPETGRYRVDGLENPYGAYPAQLPPKGYMVPHRLSYAAVPFGGKEA